MLEVDTTSVTHRSAYDRGVAAQTNGSGLNHTCCLWHLTLQQEHDVVRKQVLRRLRSMVNDALDHVQGALDRAVQKGHE
ncbi:MAG: hypothetical protein CM15mP128_1780 [Methanobacteriota archaeon]|nr:MAG: hypothetical protein CM15mP128_1780 [Euryarchaeota archaeon]